MNCDFNNMLPTGNRRAFTFMEVVTALMIVSVITFGVLIVINRSVASMIEIQARIQAFELARENMETLLASDSVSDLNQFGTHETNEDIQWETVVEAFDEPVDSRMWVRAVCSASYMDKYNQRQTIQLEHWLTGLSKTQEKQILDQREREQEFLENMEGNPFGDDPDGLMQYSKALSSMGDFAGAAEALFEIIDEYPDSPLIDLAVNNTIGIAWAALSQGDAQTAEPIINVLNRNFPDNKDVQKLPDPSQLMPGWQTTRLIIPPKFQPSSPTNTPSTGPKPGSDPTNNRQKPNDPETDPRKPSDPKDNASNDGHVYPEGYDDWPQIFKDLYNKIERDK